MEHCALEPQEIEQRLTTHRLGRNLVYLPQMLSTNDAAKEMARAGAPEGTLVIADEQKAGRGRLGRAWLAPPCSCLLLSLLLRPSLPPDKVFTLTMLAAVAVAAAIEKVAELSCGIKWPNDVLIGQRKICGILSEMGLADARVDFVVVGIGLNVNLELSLLGEMADTATSLSTELGHPIDRVGLLCQLLDEFERRYVALTSESGDLGEQASSQSWPGNIYHEWRSRLITLGQWVTAGDGQAREEGRAEDVDLDGALLVRRGDGNLIRVAAGDVTLRPAAL